jgi:threonine dehydrogenase-like Zn-dependent dehydrogenase
MKAAAFADPGSIEIIEAQTPELPPGWVRLSVASVGICGTDLHLLHGMMGDRRGIQPGHEVSGIIEHVGDGVALQSGTRVAVEPAHGCGECHHCQSGFPNRCAKLTLFGVTTNGGMADLLAVPAQCLHPIAADVSLTMAALCEPLAVCLRAARLADIGPGDRVAILGAGSIGLVAIVAARAAGAEEVYITARHPHQQALAQAMGADRVFANGRDAAAALGNENVDVVIETVGGEADTLTEAIYLARPGGTIAMLGAFAGTPEVPAFVFMAKELRLVGSNCYGHDGPHGDFALATQLAQKYQDDLLPLVTHTFALDQVAEAFATAEDKSTRSVKVHVQP